MDKKKIIIVVPAYNESEKILNVIEALTTLKNKLKDVCLNIYIVNDGSMDCTGELAKNSIADQVIEHPVNLGLGAAVRTGLIAARDVGADIAIKFDADLQHDPVDIPNLIKPIIEGYADIVYGNRFNRILYKMPFARRMGNRFFTHLMAFLTGYPVKDSQPGIFAVNSEYLKNFQIPGDYNYTQQILLDAHYRNLRFAHVDVSFNKRMTGKSFVSLKYPFKVGYQILMLIVSTKPFQIFGPVGFLSLGGAAIISFFQFYQWFIGETTKPIMNVNAVLGLLIFGIQTLFFGLLAQLIVNLNKLKK